MPLVECWADAPQGALGPRAAGSPPLGFQRGIRAGLRGVSAFQSVLPSLEHPELAHSRRSRGTNLGALAGAPLMQQPLGGHYLARDLAFLRVLACPSHSENRSHDPGLVGPIGLPISIQEAPLLYAISPTDEISLIGRLPRDVEQLQSEGWRFLASAAWWDSDDLERLAQATGLAAISPSYGQVASQKWWKAYAKSYLNKRDPVAAVEAVGEPAFNIGPREESISAPREPCSMLVTHSSPAGGRPGSRSGAFSYHQTI